MSGEIKTLKIGGNLHKQLKMIALEEDVKRQKIPLSEETWQALTALANILRAEGVSVSPGQMASAIVRQGLTQLNFLPAPHLPQRKAA